MTNPLFLPLVIPPNSLDEVLHRRGYAVLDTAGVRELSVCSSEALAALHPFWNDLPADTYLKDGGHYRRRRHSCFVVEGERVTQSPHRAHWQPLEYNASMPC